MKRCVSCSDQFKSWLPNGVIWPDEINPESSYGEHTPYNKIVVCPWCGGKLDDVSKVVTFK